MTALNLSASSDLIIDRISSDVATLGAIAWMLYRAELTHAGAPSI